MAAVLSPSLHTQQSPEHIYFPPPRQSSSHIVSLPAYIDNTPRRASNHRNSLSFTSNSSSSPTSPNKGTSPSRKFRLPVRVSTDFTSFATSDSSPQSRRRSLSVASENKRRSSQFSSLKQVEEDKKKSVPSSPTSPAKDTFPPPSYQDAENTSVIEEAAYSPPSYQDTKSSSSSIDTTPTATTVPLKSPPLEKKQSVESPEKNQQLIFSQPISVTMSSGSISP